MASKNIRIQFNSEGFRQILTSSGCHEVVQQVTNDICEKANANYNGDGFVATTQIGGYGGGRWIGFVSSSDKASTIAESEDKALTRATT